MEEDMTNPLDPAVIPDQRHALFRRMHLPRDHFVTVPPQGERGDPVLVARPLVFEQRRDL
jgi:hypothetical protein